MRLLTLTSFVLLATSTAAPAAAQPTCAAKGERTVARSADGGVVVVERRVRIRGGADVRYTACERASGRRTRLLTTVDAPDGGTSVGPFAFAGRAVAWGSTSSAKDASDSALSVRLLDRPASSTRFWPIPRHAQAIAVPPSGDVAAAVVETEVLVVDEHGARVLDTAIAGTLRELAFDGGTVSWSHGRSRRRAIARLPASCVPPGTVRVGDQRGDAAAGVRLLRDGDRLRSIPTVCRFAGAGWTDLPGEGSARLSGAFAAFAQRTDHGLLVVVTDLASGAAVGPPAALDPGGNPWTLLADGTVLARIKRGFVLHRRDGTTATWSTKRIGSERLGVDDVARAVVWQTYRGPSGSTPIP